LSIKSTGEEKAEFPLEKRRNPVYDLNITTTGKRKNQ